MKEKEVPKTLGLFWAAPIDQVFAALGTGENGLSEAEAGLRLARFGPNIIEAKPRVRGLKIAFRQLKSPLILILIAAGGITLAIGDSLNSGFVFAAVLVNSALGFYQEYKAETALAALGTYIKERARVVRGGREFETGSEKIVPGDILVLTTGNRVPADARLIAVENLSVNEALLTGEPMPVGKTANRVREDAVAAERKNFVFGGTYVSYGTGLAVVTATGRDTELGKVASLVRKSDEETPLQAAISKFSLNAMNVLLALTFGVFLIGLSKGYAALDMFVTAVAVAVSTVPEGLPIALTVILAVGVERLARQNGVVRQLLAAETLGQTTVILTDKTGTLTEASMELTEILASGALPKEDILEAALLAVNVTIENPESAPADWRLIGRPLEAAIVKCAVIHKVLLPDVKSGHRVVSRSPFDAVRKFSSVRVKNGSGEKTVFLGAPEKLLEEARMAKSAKDDVYKEVSRHARKGMRVIAVADSSRFLGLLIFKDPVRDGVKEVISGLLQSGVRTVILTGDHKDTALAVAREIGLSVSPAEIVTGAELKNWSEAQLVRHLKKIKIFARVSPEDKLVIARLYKKAGEVVAMTGDGVNDAPALREADIGVALGSGTDVAKGAADLVLLDDNFKTIALAVAEGKRMLQNLKKVMIYLLSDSLNELFLIGGALIVGLPLPLNALQILWVNFFSDSFPAVAFAFEGTPDADAGELPRGRKLFDKRMKFLIIGVGVVSSAILFFMYLILMKTGFSEQIVKTFIFASFSAYTLFLALSLRDLKKSILTYNPFSNPYLTAGVAFGLILVTLAVYFPPLQLILQTTSLSTVWLLGVLGFSLFNVFMVEFVKAWFRGLEGAGR